MDNIVVPCFFLTHSVCLSANLRCRSETCCMRLAANTGCKKVAKNCHLGTIAPLCRAISSQLRHISTIRKNLLSSKMSSTCPHNMANFGPLAAEIDPVVWGTPASFNVFRILAARHLVVGVSQTLRRWTEGATYVRQGDHHVGPSWPTCLLFVSYGHTMEYGGFFLLSFFLSFFPRLISAVWDWMSSILPHMVWP